MLRLTLALSLGLLAAPALACDGAPHTADATSPDGAIALASTALRVEGVDCANCLVPIRKELTALQGVSDVKSGADVKEIIVVFADKPLADDALVAAIKRAGFDAKVQKPTTET